MAKGSVSWRYRDIQLEIKRNRGLDEWILKMRKVWMWDEKRSAHDMMLLLLAMARMAQDIRPVACDKQWMRDVSPLIDQCAPKGQQPLVGDPIERLIGDGLWKRRRDGRSGLHPRLMTRLAEDPDSADTLARELMDVNVPQTLWDMWDTALEIA